MKRLLVLALLATTAIAAEPEVRVRKIWDAAPHNAFTDLARFHDEWFCVFREADAHIGGDGRIRVLVSKDGERWESAALLTEEGIDLRDPKLCLAPDDRLMLTLGGSVYRGTKKLQGRQPRVAFSKDGREWTTPQRVLAEGDWLWRVTWHDGVAYGTSYRTSPPEGAGTDPAEWALTLYCSSDGLAWKKIAPLAVDGSPNETTLRFGGNGEMLALVRRETGDKQGWLGHSPPPYDDWQWRPIGRFIGGPNFLAAPDGTLFAAGRDLRPEGPRTALGRITAQGWEPTITLPSGGDNSYPGMVWHEGELWLSYYSSHEDKAAIYLARVPVK
jgi:hypothetical protein